MSDNFSYIVERLSSRAQRVLITAQKLSEELRHNHTGTEHLLYGIISEKNAFGSEILLKSKLLPETVKDDVAIVNAKNVLPSWNGKVSTNLRLTLEKAAVVASRFNSPFIATEHLLFGLLECEQSLGREILIQRQIDVDEMKRQLVAIFEHNSKFPDFLGMEDQLPQSLTAQTTKVEEKITKSPALEYFTTDVTEKARNGKIDPVIGRGPEIERLVSILNRRTKNNPVLIGEPGVGKTAIVEGLALAITKGEVPDSLVGKRILALDLALVVAGSMFRGEFENRLKQVIEEVSEDKEIILFIDEMHTLVGAGATTGSLDAANILKPALARGELRAIGATTLAEYKKYIENDAALERRFQPILVEEPSIEEAIQIISGVREHYEHHHGVTITDDAVKTAVDLSVRYISDRFLPDKAIDLIDETAANLKTKNESSPKLRQIKLIERQLADMNDTKTKAVLSQDFATAQHLRLHESKLRQQKDKLEQSLYKEDSEIKLQISGSDIARTVAQVTKIPVESLVQAEVDKLSGLEDSLKSKIVGQDEAVASIADAIRRSRLGISSPTKPLGSFIFLGPSGVGKTEMAKILAEEVFQNREALIRVDMSEFMERHNVARLIGAPAGYVGYEEGGRLTENIRRKPHSIVLFDEIEKAHPDVFNILLQILEEGQLTDASGKRVNFRNTIIIMTSNIGLSELTKEAGSMGFSTEDSKEIAKAQKGFDQAKNRILESLKEVMRPELLNRIDKVLVFQPLDLASLQKIVEMNLAAIKARVAFNNINLAWNKAAIKLLAAQSLNPEQGARLVRKTLQETVEQQIARQLLKNPAILSVDKPIKAIIRPSKDNKKVELEFSEIEKVSAKKQPVRASR